MGNGESMRRNSHRSMTSLMTSSNDYREVKAERGEVEEVG